MLKDLGDAPDEWPVTMTEALEMLPAGHAFQVPEVLFAKISDDNREAWAEQFSGTRS